MMGNKTSEVLAALIAKYPKRTLLALWSDIRKLSKGEFETLLASCSPQELPISTTKRKAAHRGGHTVPQDAPASRIEHLLVRQAALDQARAAAEITAQLRRQGIAASRIPSSEGRDFTDWLSVLFQSVPASNVMHAALQISARLSREP